MSDFSGVLNLSNVRNKVFGAYNIKRGTAYRPDAFSKDLKLCWEYRSSDEAVLYSGRSLNTFESTLALVYKPQELRELLLTAGTKRTTAIEYIRSIYEGCQKRQDIYNTV